MSDFEESWKQGFLDYAAKLSRRYLANPDEVLAAIACKSVLESLMETYKLLISEGQIPKLEDLPEGHKAALWDKSKQYSDERFKRIAICKSIYMLDVLTKE